MCIHFLYIIAPVPYYLNTWQGNSKVILHVIQSVFDKRKFHYHLNLEYLPIFESVYSILTINPKGHALFIFPILVAWLRMITHTTAWSLIICRLRGTKCCWNRHSTIQNCILSKSWSQVELHCILRIF